MRSLPYVERGSIVLIGATTENPSFEINSAPALPLQGVRAERPHGRRPGGLLCRALADRRGFGGQNVEIEDDALWMIANFANGDARTALGTLEMAVLNGRREDGRIYVERGLLEQCISKKAFVRQKGRGALQSHQCAAQVHAQLRPRRRGVLAGPHAGGREDPLYVARRLVRFASEDIGLADSRALRSQWPPIRPATFWACRSAACI